MKTPSTETRQMLAAEFALGTLRGGARRRFERWLRNDRWLRGEVRYWEERFAGMRSVKPVPPRQQVWEHIHQRMHTAPPAIVVPMRAAPTPRPNGRPEVRAFDSWRAWALLATAASAVLAVLLIRAEYLVPPQERIVEVKVPEMVQTYVAALRLPDEDAQWTVSVAPDARTLRIAVNAPARLGTGNDYELWWVTDGGVQSLGLLPREGMVQRALPQAVALAPESKIAVSREPAGGAPANGGPTGPVLIAAPLLPSI